MRNPNCNLCKRCGGAKNICVWGNGTNGTTKQIMVVIDNISSAQDNTGKLIQGQGGNVLFKLLQEANIFEMCYVTAAVKCFASHKPQAKEIRTCRNYLLEEIDTVKPKLIICLGSISASAIFDKHYPIKDLRQRFFQFGNSQVAVSFSHNVIFTDPNKYSTLQKDIHWIINNFNKTNIGLDYTLKTNEDIAKGNIYGIDIETFVKEGTGLNPYIGKILTIAIANPITKESVGYTINEINR